MLLYPLWLIFAAVFFTFAYQHWRLAQQDVRSFRLREHEESGAAGEVLKDFVQDFNQYLQTVNDVNRSRSRVAMVGYLISGLLALLSLVLTLPGAG